MLASTPGDANRDGSITAADVLAVEDALGVVPPPCGTDVNGDGVVDESDVTAILEALFG